MKKMTMAVWSIFCASALSVHGGDKAAVGTRTVTGAFTTIYRPDDGTSTTLSTPPPYGQRAVALLVPDDSATGYTEFPITLGEDNVFTVEGVPNGSYFLQLDGTLFPICGTMQCRVTISDLIELATDSPDLSIVNAGRPDLARVTTRTPVTLEITNMQPWQSGNIFLISSSQGDAYLRPLSGRLTPPPTIGATSYTGVFDWNLASTSNNIAGLPDGARGDVVFFNQRSTLSIGEGDGAAELRYASRYARLTDFTVVDGKPSTLTASLIETQQTGNTRADVRGSEFGALAPEVNPSARPAQSPSGNLAFSIQAVPHSVQYPDMPASSTSSLFYFQSLTPNTSDFNYGTFDYPQFHDSIWTEWRFGYYYFDVTLLVPGTKEPIDIPFAASVFFSAPMSPPPEDPIAPALGPPTAPLINGADAFAPQSGVGVQPILSWSPPDLGTATSYGIAIRSLLPEEGERWLAARIYSGNSFRVPPGFLRPGHFYYAVITANAAEYDVVDRAPFRSGSPSLSSDCITGIFTP